MEHLEFEYPGRRQIRHRTHVGVVGSGDLEVLLEPNEGSVTRVAVQTNVTGFEATWRAVLDRFFARYDGIVNIEINDNGATPGVVMLRLLQAAEMSNR